MGIYGVLKKVEGSKEDLLLESSPKFDEFGLEPQNTLDLGDMWFVLHMVLKKLDVTELLVQGILGGEWIESGSMEKVIRCTYVSSDKVKEISKLLDGQTKKEIEKHFSLSDLQEKKIYPYHEDLVLINIYKDRPDSKSKFYRDNDEERKKLSYQFFELVQFYKNTALQGKSILAYIVDSGPDFPNDHTSLEVIFNTEFLQSSIDGLFNHLGKKIGPEVIKILGNDFKVSRFTDGYYLCYYSKGISLRFDNKDKLAGIWIYTEGEENYKQYTGLMPKGLSWKDNRGDVENKLGKPQITSKDAHPRGEGKARCYAVYSQLGLTIDYDSVWSSDLSGKITRICITNPTSEIQDERFLMRCDESIAIQIFSPATPEVLMAFSMATGISPEKNETEEVGEWKWQFFKHEKGMDNVLGQLDKLLEDLESLPDTYVTTNKVKLVVDRTYHTTMLMGISMNLKQNELKKINALGMEITYNIHFSWIHQSDYV